MSNAVRSPSGYAWLAQKPPTWWLRTDTQKWHAYCGNKTWGDVPIARCGKAFEGEGVGPYTEPLDSERVCKRCRYLVATDALVRGD